LSRQWGRGPPLPLATPDPAFPTASSPLISSAVRLWADSYSGTQVLLVGNALTRRHYGHLWLA